MSDISVSNPSSKTIKPMHCSRFGEIEIIQSREGHLQDDILREDIVKIENLMSSVCERVEAKIKPKKSQNSSSYEINLSSLIAFLSNLEV